jgi:hypothetical protein
MAVAPGYAGGPHMLAEQPSPPPQVVAYEEACLYSHYALIYVKPTLPLLPCPASRLIKGFQGKNRSASTTTALLLPPSVACRGPESASTPALAICGVTRCDSQP